MPTQAELDAAQATEDAAIAALLASQASLITEMQNAFNRFIAKIGTPPTIDLTAEIATVNAQIQKLTDANTAITAAITTAQAAGN